MAYTYLIGWSKLDTWYYGVRYSDKAKPSDLWVKYFTSSKHVKAFALVNGPPDVIEVRREFTDKEKSWKWESTVLRRMKVRTDDRWLNKNDRPAPPIMFGEDHPAYGVRWTPEQRAIQSEKLKGKLKGRPKSEEHKQRIAASRRLESAESRARRSEAGMGEKNSMYGKKMSEDTRAKMRESHRKRYEKMRAEGITIPTPPQFHGTHTDETKQKISKTKLMNNLMKYYEENE